MFKGAAKLQIVVNLTVEDQLVTPVRCAHGLVACRTQIQDCKPSKAEHPIVAAFESVVVWTSVLQDVQQSGVYVSVC